SRSAQQRSTTGLAELCTLGLPGGGRDRPSGRAGPADRVSPILARGRAHCYSAPARRPSQEGLARPPETPSFPFWPLGGPQGRAACASRFDHIESFAFAVSASR